MLVKVNSGAIIGLTAVPITVEVDFSRMGLTSFTIVGLPDAAVQESRERVRSAIRNRGMDFPLKRFVVNLAPAELRKEGPSYDLPIAIGVLAATDQLPLESLSNAMFVGELSLDGELRHTRGIMALAALAREQNYTTLYVPESDAAEAALIDNIDVIPVPTIGHLVEHVYQLNPIPPFDRRNLNTANIKRNEHLVDFGDIKGQEYVKRAAEIAAAGNHHLIL